MSPVSLSGSDWSGINNYQKPDPSVPQAPENESSSSFLSHPSSGSPNNRPMSPPSSVNGRSSVQTISALSEPQQARRRKMMDDSLARHYTVFQRFLNATHRDIKSSPRSDRAKDKLLRLSPTQFYELSTDVYDELLRRQQATAPPHWNGQPRPEVPPYLPPRKEFHVKRNQARQKLSTLQHQRFRDLAMDVFRELERRFPNFRSREPPPPSLPPSGYPLPGPGPNGYPYGPPRPKSRGSVRQSNYPPRRPSSRAPRPGRESHGRPFPNNNTIVPNKSTLVEEDDDEGADSDGRSDIYGLESTSRGRSGTTTTISDGERKQLQESQSQVSSLHERIQSLENSLRSKDEQLEVFMDEQGKAQVCIYMRVCICNLIANFASYRTSMRKGNNGAMSGSNWRVSFRKPRI